MLVSPTETLDLFAPGIVAVGSNGRGAGYASESLRRGEVSQLVHRRCGRRGRPLSSDASSMLQSMPLATCPGAAAREKAHRQRESRLKVNSWRWADSTLGGEPLPLVSMHLRPVSITFSWRR